MFMRWKIPAVVQKKIVASTRPKENRQINVTRAVIQAASFIGLKNLSTARAPTKPTTSTSLAPSF
jgi:hypothetical protein